MTKVPSFLNQPPVPEIPPQPTGIKQVTTVAVPTGQVSQRFVTLIYGLGDDNKMYMWAGDIKAWVLA